METIVRNKLVEVTYHRGEKLLVYEWHGLVNFDVGIETFKTTMGFIKINPCHFVLHDATDMKGTFTKLNDFMSREVLPNFERHGGQRSAMVISRDVFSIFAINQYLKIVKTNTVEIKLFKQRNEAMSWLNEVRV